MPNLQQFQTNEALSKRIIGLAMKVHRVLGGGFVESVYGNALYLELQQSGIDFECEKIYPVFYGEIEVGVFQADFVIENRLIIELKAVEALSIAHSVQLVNYLASSKIDKVCLSISATKASSSKPRLVFTKKSHRRPIYNSNPVNSVCLPVIPSYASL